MLLIPIGQEDGTVRRLPVVTYALLAANVLAFFLTWGPSVAARGQVEARLRAAVGYLNEHPYLSVPPDLAQLLDADLEAELTTAREEWRARAQGLSSELTSLQQDRLNSLAEDAAGAADALPSKRLGFTPARPGGATLISYMFIHAGWLHLLGNMLILFVAGPFVEDVYGRLIFSTLYLVAGVASAGAEAARFPDSVIPLVGASGAIAGVMGAFLVRLWKARIRFLFIPLPILPMLRTTLLLPAFIVLPAWAAEQYWYATASADPSGVAFSAHLGGFAFGVAAAVGMKLTRVEEVWVNPAIEAHIGLSQHPDVTAALDARLAGDLRGARVSIGRALEAEPSNVDAWRESYEIALAEGDSTEVGRSGGRTLELLVRQSELGQALEIAGDSRHATLEGVPVRFSLELATFWERQGNPDQALDVYQRIARDAFDDPGALRALLRAADLSRQLGNVPAARATLERARGHLACTGAWPATIDRAMARLRDR